MSSDNITTNIRLPKQMWKALKKKALQEGKSLSALFREGVMCVLGETLLTKSQFKKDPFLKIIGKGKHSQKGSAEHDKDIYENEDFC